MILLNTPGDRLKYALDKRKCPTDKKGWTHQLLADYIKVQKTMIYRYINGIHNISRKRAIQIGAALDISIDWLLKGKGAFEDGFNIQDYTCSEIKKISVEKSHLGGYNLTFSLTDDEMKAIILETLK